MDALLGLSSAFGLSGSAGLNAYIPLLLVALAARFPLNSPFLQLEAPYDVMGSWWTIGILSVMLVIEMLVDKVPAVDHINDVLGTFIRPAAGAILFAANANVVTDIHPALAIGAGIIMAGSVHAAKATTRPVVTAATVGTGNWVVSLAEDVVAFFTSLLAILAPFLAILGMVIFTIMFVRIWRRLKRRREKKTAVAS